MTQEEAKEYVLTHLPCTMVGVVTLFDNYFHGSVKLEKLVGLSAGALGYGRLVFTLRFDFKVMAEIHPMPTLNHLMGCFRAWARFQGFTVEREGFDMSDKECYVVWAKAPVEIKEDRGK